MLRLVGFILLLAFRDAQAAKDVKSECIPSKDDYSHFHCLPSEVERIPCVDAEEKECPKWASRGECAKNPQYMLIECRKSCDSCIGLHSGVTQIAPDNRNREKVLKSLVETQEYMHKEAQRSVETLAKCANKHELCTHWSVLGECTDNAVFMHKECAPACRTCDKVL